MKGKLREMVAKIVASVNEMVKYSSLAYCTLLLHTGVHTGKNKEYCYRSCTYMAIGTWDARESGFDDYH